MITSTIIVAVVAFLAVTLVLVGLLLYAKAKLTSSGAVTIDINDGEKVLTTESGSTLLVTLANNNVFLPSACGGGGSCGMCKCQVLEGGGDILPTETGFISRKMAKALNQAAVLPARTILATASNSPRIDWLGC